MSSSRAKIGLLTIGLLIPGSRSLKDKRRVVKSLKEQLRSRYNCSVAETAHHELWGRAEVSICIVSSGGGHVNEQLHDILRFADNKPGMEIGDYHIETV